MALLRTMCKKFDQPGPEGEVLYSLTLENPRQPNGKALSAVVTLNASDLAALDLAVHPVAMGEVEEAKTMAQPTKTV